MQSRIKHLLKHFALVLKAKLNQLKPFVRFVFQPSTLLHPPINLFIKGLRTQTFFTLLYASFSCPYTHQRRVSFEYIVMSGLNDSPRHIRELTRLLNGIKCRINLIRFHRIPDSPYFSPGDEAMVRFRDALTARGIQTTIRASRGEDIQAACGLLSTRLKGGI